MNAAMASLKVGAGANATALWSRLLGPLMKQAFGGRQAPITIPTLRTILAGLARIAESSVKEHPRHRD